MTNHDVHYSRAGTGGRDDWGTPDALFRQLDAMYGPFNLDAAATAENSKCDAFIGLGYSPLLYRISQDALGPDPWQDPESVEEDRIWLNPPYSRLGEFLTRAAEEAEAGTVKLVCCLVPARTDTKVWHEVVMAKASEVLLIKGRVRFEGAAAGAPFPSAVVIFDGYRELHGDSSPWFKTLEQKR